MKKISMSIGLFMSFISLCISQIKTEDFAFMQGNWTGVLEYTNYQDDKSKVQLITRASCALILSKMMIQYTYMEPNGTAVYEKMRVFAGKKGDIIQFGSEKLKIIKNTEGVLVMEGKGADNDKKALIRETIRYSKDSLCILKQIQYVGKSEWIDRHEYRFKKEKAEDTQARF